jgi:hypothetical protein
MICPRRKDINKEQTKGQRQPAEHIQSTAAEKKMIFGENFIRMPRHCFQITICTHPQKAAISSSAEEAAI